MKIGIILAAYACENTVKDCLAPWLQAIEKHDIELGIVSVPFKDFPPQDNKITEQIIIDSVHKTKAFLLSSDQEMTEHDARNMPLEYFRDQGFDYIWLVDGDEIYTLEQIDRIINFIADDKYTMWWALNFKNYVFTPKTWIEGFCPPRIFRMKSSENDLVLNEFYWDNDVYYLKRSSNPDERIPYQSLPNISIPTSTANIKHLTWLNNDNSRRKVQYQLKHFGVCSYLWDYEFQELRFDPEFHKKNNIPIPQLHSD